MGRHFLPHKFIKRTFKCWVNSTKQFLNASRGHQAPRKAAHCLWKEIFNPCFLVFVNNFVPLRTQSSVLIYTWERDYWLDCSLPLWTLLFLHQVASVSSLPPLFSTQLCESLCSRWWRTLRELITGWICFSPFHSPLLSSWPPLSPSSLFSSLYNSVNISEQSRLWSAHKEVITG